MTVRVGRSVDYASRRLVTAHPHTLLSVRPRADVVEGDPLADFLTARWGLHVRSCGTTRYVRNEHPTWALHRAKLVSLDDGLIAAAWLPGVAARPPDSVLYSDGVTARFSRPSRRITSAK